MERFTRMLLALLLLTYALLASAEPVDINTADAATLASNLSGVGAAKAEAIVAYRNTNGAFQNAQELTRVKGIGQRILELNRDSIVVGSAPGMASSQ